MAAHQQHGAPDPGGEPDALQAAGGRRRRQRGILWHVRRGDTAGGHPCGGAAVLEADMALCPDEKGAGAGGRNRPDVIF